MPICLIGLGANEGRRQETLDRAVEELRHAPGIAVVRSSRWYRTRPAGGPSGQAFFLNGAALLETSLAPESLWARLQEIERELGRRPGERWGPRPIDLDLLLYGDRVLHTASLEVPHPRMAWRRFVLEPAAEIAPALVHPGIGWSVARLLAHLDTSPDYVAITGPIGAGKTRLARAVAQQTGARLVVEEPDLAALAAFYRDPAGKAWSMEVQFLNERTRLLAAPGPGWPEHAGPAVSDFWFEQSLAFAEVWLSPPEFDAFQRQWAAARQQVVEPRLVVVLDAPGSELHERVRRRGRACERDLEAEQLERIRRAVLARAAAPGLGPVLRLASDDFDRVLAEVVAATEAMHEST